MSPTEQQDASLLQTLPSLGRVQTNGGDKIPESVEKRSTTSEKAAGVVAALVPLSEKSSGISSPPERTRREKVVSNIQFAALCWSMMLVGWSDGSTGPLLPRLREVYDVSRS